MMIRSTVAVLLLAISADATFFNGGCGCPPPPPPPPMCMTTIQLPPIQIPTIPLPRIEHPQPCCPTCACGRKKREVDVDEAPKDVACNDDKLFNIMKKEMTSGESSKIKIALVEAAEVEIGGRFTVICSQGAFSFVTSTTNYCLHSQNGLNCYLFKTQ
ncbi:unnamed protein product [Caenorhabditis bovis]|uniref:Ground-like domain-containing protein n=1 Tax=Caenorhabditis bovis TaxID=2654633 RepID=A0A8S1ESD7_9PELO|nr:unnamed protein product [Caenorhabditis bovis]